jgi:hypothetical protein
LRLITNYHLAGSLFRAAFIFFITAGGKTDCFATTFDPPVNRVFAVLSGFLHPLAIRQNSHFFNIHLLPFYLSLRYALITHNLEDPIPPRRADGGVMTSIQRTE